MHLDANNGGCWFCETDDEGTNIFWNLSFEFDCNYHIHCLYAALRGEIIGRSEAVIMYREILENNYVR